MRMAKTLRFSLRRVSKWMRCRTYGVYHKCMVLTASAVAAAVVLLFLEGVGGTGNSTVHAETVHKEAAGERVTQDEGDGIQAGILGILDGISRMEKYSDSAGDTKMPDVGCEVLVGASRAYSGHKNRMILEKEIQQVSKVGYGASQLVRENQMPYDDYDALLRIVEAEATGCDLKGKILVANVVLNRVKDSRFPDRIYDVVWQNVDGEPQFSPTTDGRINSVEITEETVEAVDRALSGEDYSEGALFFMAKSDSEQQNVEWFESKLCELFEYGGHEFFTYPE